MNCTDCLHYEICNALSVVDDDICECFKNKSKYIELPCPIGTTVYMVTSGYDSWDNTEFKKVIQVPFRLDILKSFNKRFFLTEEEAERKLREL